MEEKFTENASRALNRSIKFAEKFGHTYIGTEHLLLGLLEDDGVIGIVGGKITFDKFKRAVCEYSGVGEESSLTARDITPRCKRILESSYHCATKYKALRIATEHMLYSLLDERDCIATRLLKNLGVDILSMKEDVLNVIKNRAAYSQGGHLLPDIPTLKQYGKNFIELARLDKFDPVIGRDRETERLIRVLCRKNKNNPCLIGEAGVGKSAIVEGLAKRIADGNVPESLKDKVIISVDLTSMVAGAKYRGDFEERIKSIVSEATKNDSIILFIDELHTIVGAGAAEGAIDASNILKPQLSRGDLQIIGATTYSEYRKYIEKDPALERRFQPITIEEPSAEKTYEMLRGIKKRYEDFHHISISDEMLRLCIQLSSRYINDRFMPDKAIDLLDEACALASSRNQTKSQELEIINDRIRQIKAEKENAIINQDYALALALNDEEESYCQQLSTRNDDLASQVELSEKDIKTVVSEISGIDVTLVRSETDYEEIEHSLKRKLIGQDEAIESLILAIKRSEYDLYDVKKPRGTFLFVGESGVGKTALATLLAEELFLNQNALLRFDMSEYSEKHSVSKLIGAPPGYAGYDDGGALTEGVRKRPYSVILFDEIEKADKEVSNLFLQIADYGYLTDSSGRRVSFRNCIIIMTSNVTASQSFGRKAGFVGENDKDELLERLRKHFSDEFLNRFDEIIKFNELNESTVATIVEKRLESLKESLSKMGIALFYDTEIIDYITEKGRQKGFGARPLIKFISVKIENPIAELLIKSKTSEIKKITISVEDGKISVKEAKLTVDSII